MGIPLAALSLRQPRFEGPLDQYGKAVRLKSLLQGQEINQFNLQQAQQQAKQQQLGQQQQAEQQEKMQALWEAAGYKLDRVIELAPEHKIGVEAYRSLIDARTKRRKDNQGMTLEDNKIARGKAETIGSAAGGILSLSPEQRPAAIQRAIPVLVEQGVMSQEEGQQYQQLAQLPPEQLESMLKMIQLASVDAGEQQKAEEKRKERTTKEKDYQYWAEAKRKAENLAKSAKVDLRLRTEYARQGEKGPSTPFAAFASGDPEQQKVAEKWIALQNKYRQAMQDETGLTPNQKRQLDSINARFNREMKVAQASMEYRDQPEPEEIARMEAILRKANEDYDAVLGGKAPRTSDPLGLFSE